jgi:hypothetical protein
MNDHAAEFINLMKHPLKLRWFLFTRLPSAFFSGVRLKDIDGTKAVATVPYKWFSQNPFRSTYFACLSMAAELSTGTLAMSAIYKRNPPISMLVVKVESEYFKKATGRSYFTCSDGAKFNEAIKRCVQSGEPVLVRAHSEGKNENGEIVAEFYITWSFKVKSKA